MICPQCHKENRPGDKFCEQCGFPLSGRSPVGQEKNVAATMVDSPSSEAVLISADDPNQTFPLGSRVVVGRLDSCDIPIHDKSVSREHARLSQLPGGYVVEDLGSTNGTLVNGEPITEAVILRSGDTVTFGSVDFRFEDQQAPAAGPEIASTQPFIYHPTDAAPQDEPAPASSETASTQAFTYEQPETVPEEQEARGLQVGASTTQVAPSTDGQVASTQPFDFPPPQPLSPLPSEPATAADADSAPERYPEPPAPEAPPPSSQPIPPPRTPSEPPARESTPFASPASRASHVTSESANEAVDTAARLLDLVRALAAQAQATESLESQLQDSVRELDAARSAQDMVARALRDVPSRSLTPQSVQSTQDALDHLIQNPRDIELLMQLGRQATDLAAIVNEYSQLRRVVERMAASLGTPLSD